MKEKKNSEEFTKSSPTKIKILVNPETLFRTQKIHKILEAHIFPSLNSPYIWYNSHFFALHILK